MTPAKTNEVAIGAIAAAVLTVGLATLSAARQKKQERDARHAALTLKNVQRFEQ